LVCERKTAAYVEKSTLNLLRNCYYHHLANKYKKTTKNHPFSIMILKLRVFPPFRSCKKAFKGYTLLEDLVHDVILRVS